MSITNKLNQIKNAIYGKEVRGAIHDAIKQVYDDASVNHDNANMEVKLARGTHDTLNDRLVKSEQKLDETNAQLSTKIQEVANKGTTVEVLQKTTQEYIEEKINDGTISNLTISKNSITSDKYKDNSIKTTKLMGNSITAEKIEFVDTTGNDIYNSEYTRKINIWKTTDNVTISENGYDNCRGIIHPVKPNTRYKIRKLSDTNKFMLVLLNASEISSDIYLGDKSRLLTEDSTLCDYVFNTGDFNYIAFQYTNQYEVTDIELLEDYYCELDVDLVHLKNEKLITNERLENDIISTKKLQNNSVTSVKTSFIDVDGNNVYNSEYKKSINIWKTPNNVTVSSDGYDNCCGIIHPVKPNTRYKLRKLSSSNKFRILLFNESELNSNMYLSHSRIVTIDDTLEEYVFETKSFDRIAYQHSSSYQAVNIELLEDYQEELSEDVSLKKSLNNVYLTDLHCRNKQISTIKDTSSFWGIPVHTSDDDGYHFNITTSALRGLTTHSINPSDLARNELEIKLNITDLSDGGTVQIWLDGLDHSGVTYLHQIASYNEIGEYVLVLDLVYREIYSSLSLNNPVRVVLASSTSANNVQFTINRFDVYDCNSDIDTSVNLQENLNMLKRDVESIKLDSSTQKPVFLTNASGEQYALQLNGQSLTLVPRIPNNVLFIGNSLLSGFGDFGMAASDIQHDYYYHVTEYIKSKLGDRELIANKLSGSAIESLPELNHSSESMFYNNLSSLCSDDVRLVIVQLGDNVNDDTKLANWNPLKLCRFLRENCPNARVAWLSMWYYREKAHQMIADACDKTGVQFVSITDLYTQQNQSYLGAVITHPDGHTEVVESMGVATHPGDKGMLAIASRIIDKVL